MNVYDFDGTIYNGDSSVDFYLFCLKQHPKICFRLPKQIWSILMYKLGKLTKTQMKECFFEFLNDFNLTDSFLDTFWQLNRRKIFSWYIDQKKHNDLIISASPTFLLKPICDQLNVQLIASEVDIHSGSFLSNNCYGSEKVKRFHSRYGPTAIADQFYTDSWSDKPMMLVANTSFFCTKGKIKEIKGEDLC